MADSLSLKCQGGSTWGYAQEGALEDTRQVLQITVPSMVKHGEAIPEDPNADVQVFAEPPDAITG